MKRMYSLLLLFISLFAVAQTETEPNNTFDLADPMGYNTMVTGTIMCGNVVDDNDYFKTLTPVDGRLRIYIERTNTGTSNAGYFYLTVYDKLKTQFYNDFNGYVAVGATRYDTIDITCRAADSMYFRINNVNTCFSYKLHYEIINNDPVQPFDTSPNESFATASSFRPVVDTIRGRIKYTRGDFTDDNDYYKTLTPADGTLRVYIERTNTSVSNSGYFYLSIYDRSQQQFYNDFNGYVDAGATRYDTINITCRAADSMYFRINNVNTCFTYKLRYEVVNNDVMQPFDTAPNESFATATNFRIKSDTIRGRINYTKGGSSDVDDYYKTYLPQDGTLRVYIERTNTSVSNSGYFYLSIYDRLQQQFYNDFNGYVDAGATRYDTINIPCRGADSMYFRINNVNTCFSYKLRYEVINRNQALDTVANESFATATNLNMNDTIIGTLKYQKGGFSDDDDYFKAYMPTSGTLRIYLERTNSSASNAGFFYLSLYNRNQSQFYNEFHGYVDAGVTRYDTINIHCRSADSIYFRINNVNTCFNYKLRYEVTLGKDTTVKICPGFTTNIDSLYNTSPFGTIKYENMASPGPGISPKNVGVGLYRLTVYNGTDCSRDTALITVAGLPKPLPGYTLNSNPQCFAANNFTFTNTSTVSEGTMTYRWTFGDNTSSTETSPSHSYTATGTYSVKLVATSSNGCKDSLEQTVTINPKPVAGFTINTASQCINGNSYSFTNTSTISGGTITYEWSFGDTGSSTLASPTYTYSAAGTYSVRMIATSNNGCKDSTIKTVTVNAKPALGADQSITISCLGGTADLRTAYLTSGYTSVTYSTATPATVSAGVYNLIVNNAAGCSDTAVITVQPAPDVTIAAMGANTKTATRECTDAQGWTHYYNDNGTTSDFSDDIILLSIKKNGNNIGTAGNGSLQITTATTTGAGSNSGVMVNSPAISNTSGFWAFNRYWKVTPANQPGTPVGIRFYYTTQDLNDVNGSNAGHTHQQLIFYKVNSGNPDPTTNFAGAQEVSSIVNGAEASSTTWTYHQLNTNTYYAEFMASQLTGGGAGVTGNNLTLPLKLVSFSAELKQQDVLVEWKTAQEVNTSHFVVEKSIDGNTFKSVGNIRASGSTASSYTFNDYNAAKAGTDKLYYRLTMADKDGSKSYSPVVSVKLNSASALSISPNPARNIVYVKGNNIQQILLIDNTGKVVLTEKVNNRNVHQLNISKFAKGLYMVSIIDKDGSVQTEKLIIQ